MKVGDYCKRGAITIESTADAAQAARVMRQEHVGFLVVVQEGDPQQKPLGVITDRDLVVEVSARDVDPHSIIALDIMTRDPLVAKEDDDLSDALQAMRIGGLRRVPVLTASGSLKGVLAIDDAIDVIAGLLCDLSGSIRNEQRQERRLRAG